MGKDRHGKTQVVLWDTSRLRFSGEVSVLTKAHTEASIKRIRVAAFDDSRYWYATEWELQINDLMLMDYSGTSLF